MVNFRMLQNDPNVNCGSVDLGQNGVRVQYAGQSLLDIKLAASTVMASLITLQVVVFPHLSETFMAEALKAS